MRIALLCPDASRNPLVRAYPIARVLQRRHTLQVLGFRSGPEIFAPYRDAFDYDTLALRDGPAFLGQVRALARRVDADALYVFKPLATSLWAGLLARRRLRIPLFLDIEDWEFGAYLGGTWRDRLHHLRHVERPTGFVWTWLSEKLVARADEIFVVSRFLERRFGGTRLVHGADTARFDPARFERAEALRRLGLDDRRWVVFTGTPNRDKGLEDLLEAVERLGDPHTRVLLVGAFHDERQRAALLARHAARLHIVGPRPHDEMPLFLALAHAVALPQRDTAATRAQVPGKVFEAMAMACPILATAVSDLPEILDGCGRVVPPHTPEALAHGLETLLARGAEARALGREARRRCEERYSWDAMEKVLTARLARWEPRA